MQGEIKDYRQPVVTSVGILLGFMLNFLAGWARGSEGGIGDVADAIILSSLCIAVVLMVIVLFRILNGSTPPDPARSYRITLVLYGAAIVVAFVGLALAVLL